MDLDHFAGRAGVLPFGVAVEISPTNRCQMRQRRQRDQKNKKSVARRRRSNCGGLEKSFFNPQGVSGGGHVRQARAGRCPPLRAGEYLLCTHDISPSLPASAAVLPLAFR